jgi:hypothetical protein
LSELTVIHVPVSIEVLCKSCFSNCISFASITFESNLKLQQIDESAFAWSELTTIHVRASVEMLCKSCFSNSNSLGSITFESNSKVRKHAVDSIAESPFLRRVEYPPSLPE